MSQFHLDGDVEVLREESDEQIVPAKSMVPVVPRAMWRDLFMDFISHLTVNTKDYGDVVLADRLYAAQTRFLDEICTGLEQGIRHFVVLKARQLGISTVGLALDLFWLSLHPGMQGALITDTAENLAKFRVIIAQLLAGLPKKLKIKFDGNNRNMLVFSNGSVLDYVVAGIREKGKGRAITLGTSRAYNFIHCTELSNWGDSSSYASLMAALSEHHKDRLYIFESTARGFNLFYDIWDSSVNDPETQRAIFIGWWAKESYSVKFNSNVYLKYWDGLLTAAEEEQQKICLELYGITIRPEQWAWYRWKKATRLTTEGSMESEYPFHEREAFVSTGKGFFPVKQVSNDLFFALGETGFPMTCYYYQMGEEFVHTKVEHTVNIREADLRIWEVPAQYGNYVLGVDVAYGRDENNDRNCVQVFRCFADKMVQVAEFASSMPTPGQLAWIICHLAGNYRHCMINIEINGPGNGVKQELDHLKFLLQNGYLDRTFVKQQGFRDFFTRAKYYIYHRPDSMGAGYAWFTKTGVESKQVMMGQYKDLYLNKQMEIKSGRLLREMQTIVQDGFEIRGSGANKDDMCMATALAVKAYIEWIRPRLINEKRTQENDMRAEENSKKPYAGFVRSIYDEHMKRQKEMRQRVEMQEAWAEDGDDFTTEEAGMDVTYETGFGEGEEIYG